ncbi:MAG: hypothetical protein NTX44_07860 [Ignavibacteriales bacterium]|nr:hypothetical protein [Ignavibacteriales bacterium]
MKKVLAILLCVDFILCASECISAQHSSIKESPADTTHLKLKVPQKQIHKHNEQTKKIESHELKLLKHEIMKNDQPLLMKEKDSLQNKTK